MGGNALSSQTKRLFAEDFKVVLREVELFISQNGGKYLNIPYYRQKESFGDLDIIVNTDFAYNAQKNPNEDMFHNIKKKIVHRFHSRSFHQNNNVLSFEYRSSPHDSEGFQVDFICFPEKEMLPAANYFSYNDLGNLLGRIAHKMGMSYGHQGLLYPMREKDKLMGVITLTNNVDDALTFLGYEPRIFHKGFDTLEDIYAYVCSSPYFNKDIYLLENRNHSARTRDKKRAVYNGFLKYVQDMEGGFIFPEKDHWLPKIEQNFESFSVQRNKILHDIEVKKEIKELFNGNIVNEVLAIEGKELKKFISFYKDKLDASSGECFLSYLKSIDVRADILSSFDEYEKKNLSSFQGLKIK